MDCGGPGGLGLQTGESIRALRLAATFNRLNLLRVRQSLTMIAASNLTCRPIAKVQSQPIGGSTVFTREFLVEWWHRTSTRCGLPPKLKRSIATCCILRIFSRTWRRISLGFRRLSFLMLCCGSVGEYGFRCRKMILLACKSRDRMVTSGTPARRGCAGQ